jgi:excisionase family DNA binding protein
VRKITANDDLMTTREAGELLGVAVRTVQLWVESGVLPAWRTAGGHRRIARAAVDKLMAERSQMLSPAATSVDTSSVEPVKILLVEDDVNLLRLFAMVVQKWDFPVELTMASNGFEGLLRIGQVCPHMVITDLNMPFLDGFEMLRSIKKPGSGCEDLILVAVTAFTPEEVVAKGGLPDGVIYFRKPVDYTKLRTLARDLFGTDTQPAPLLA